MRKRRGKKIGLEELEEEISLRKKKKKKQRRSATWAQHAISNFCLFVLFVFVSFFCFFLCQSSTFSLSLNPSPSCSFFWFMGSWVHAISRLLIHGFMGLIFLGSGCWWFFWVHGLDYLLKKSIKEKKILIILIFWASFHLLFYKTWRTVLGSPAFVLGLLLIRGFSSCFPGFDGD